MRTFKIQTMIMTQWWNKNTVGKGTENENENENW